jgi:hypothetical protein
MAGRDPEKERRVFVIMPFGEGVDEQAHRDRYEAIILRAIDMVNAAPDAERGGFRLVGPRADSFPGPARITPRITEELQTAPIVIADLTGFNPNVMYELGIRHALASGTILLAPANCNPPFNIQDHRYIAYARETDSNAAQKLKEALLDVVRQIGSTGRVAGDGPLAIDPLLDDLPRETLTRAAEGFAREIAGFLSESDVWTGIGDNQSLFAQRVRHFNKEKQFIGGRFVPLLIARCKALIESGRDVVLVIDSGTTLVPVFEHLFRAAVGAQGQPWTTQLSVVTNSLSGLARTITHGRVKGDVLSIASCRMLPGTPNPLYAAVLGQDTVDALRVLRDESEGTDAGKRPRHFVGIVTGNWVRVTDGNPIPLARHEGHYDFKKAVIEVCDESYVLAPLGKIFIERSPADINAVANNAGEPYRDVDVGEKGDTLRLITTSRQQGRLLHGHGKRLSNAIRAVLSIKDALPQFASATTRPHHLLDEFDAIPREPDRQRLWEYPHEHTRWNNSFRGMFESPD